MMQVQIDTLHQGIQDYNMRTNDLVSQLKQLSLELRLIEIMNGEEQDGKGVLETCSKSKRKNPN